MAEGTLLNGSIPGSKPLPLTSHFGRPPAAAQVEQAGADVHAPAQLRSTRRCERCGKLLARTSPNTRQDIPFHKLCWADAEVERVTREPLSPTTANPLVGLL